MSFLKKPASHHAIDRQCKTQASHYSNLLLIMVSDQPGILHLFPLSTKSISSGETTVQYALLLTNPYMQKNLRYTNLLDPYLSFMLRKSKLCITIMRHKTRCSPSSSKILNRHFVKLLGPTTLVNLLSFLCYVATR